MLIKWIKFAQDGEVVDATNCLPEQLAKTIASLQADGHTIVSVIDGDELGAEEAPAKIRVAFSDWTPLGGFQTAQEVVDLFNKIYGENPDEQRHLVMEENGHVWALEDSMDFDLWCYQHKLPGPSGTKFTEDAEEEAEKGKHRGMPMDTREQYHNLVKTLSLTKEQAKSMEVFIDDLSGQAVDFGEEVGAHDTLLRMGLLDERGNAKEMNDITLAEAARRAEQWLREHQ